MRKIFSALLAMACMHIAASQPSLQQFSRSIQNSAVSGSIVKFEHNSQLSFLGSLQFVPGAGPSEQQLTSWLTQQLSLRPGIDQLAVEGRTEQNMNQVGIVRINQSYRGIPVEHARINVTVKQGKAESMQLEFYSVPQEVPVNPSLDEAAALNKAVAYIGAQTYVWQNYTGNDPELSKPKGNLVIVEDVFNKTGQVCLAWKFMIHAEAPLFKGYVYVNANDGNIVFLDKIIKHANTPGSADTKYSGTQAIVTDNTGANFRLRELRNGDSIITVDYQRRVQSSANDLLAVDFTDNDNNWTTAEFNNANFDNAALDAHFGIEKVSDYWNLVHARAGWDNAHSKMKSFVHIRATAGSGYDNAFWGGSAMYYGDGTYPGNANGFLPLTSLDVTAHELGHAICQTTAALVYMRESGGLNEGFSDIWGAAVEHYSGLAGAKQNFRLAEEIFPSSGFLRDMQNPNLGGQPDTYFGTLWSPTTLGGCPFSSSNVNDNCGVHTNSGVINKWFYILVQGETGTNDNGDAYSVTGLNWTKAEQITYLTEQNLTANSNYAATRSAAINAATTLFGACSNEVIQVTNAWFAVGVGTSANCLPRVEFANGITTTAEGSGLVSTCASKQVNVAVKLGAVATQNTTINFTTAGTALNNVHYSLPASSLTFNTGESGSKNFVVNVLDNAGIDGNKTIVLNYTINNNGGNAAAGVNNQAFTLTITDDDAIPASIVATPIVTTQLLNENFEANVGALPTGWSGTLFFTGGGGTNVWTVGSNGGAGISGQAAYITSNAGSKPLTYTATSTTDRLLRSKVLSTTGLTNLKLSFKYKAEGEYYLTPPTGPNVYDLGRLMYSLNGSTFNFLNDPATGAPYIFYGNGSSVVNFAPVSLPAGLENQATVYIAWRWTNDNSVGINPALLVDDVLLTGQASGAAAETQSSQSITSNLIQGNFNSYLYSSLDSQLVARITNPDAAVGCITAQLTAAGSGQMMVPTASGSYLATQKIIQLTPAIPNSTVNYTSTLYFTAAELAIWGASKTSLKILKVQDGVNIGVTPLTASNSKIITPSSVIDNTATTGIISYTGNFTGFSQFLLVEPSIILPVQLTDFIVVVRGEDALLSWKTKEEINNKGFEILRSFDGATFEKIGFVAGKINSGIESSYSFTDPAIRPNINIYYRLRQVDLDDKATLSEIRNVKKNKEGYTLAWLSPNPATSLSIVNLDHGLSKGRITILDASGKQVYSKDVPSNMLIVPVDVSRFASGVYLVQVSDGNTMETLKLVRK
jgi:Zn-dependent metalloprotease